MLSLFKLPNSIEGEKIIQVVRKDFFIMFRKIVLALFLAVLYVGLLFFILETNGNLLANPIFSALIVLASSAYSLFVLLFFYFSFIDYYLDVSIVTSERIIDITQNGLFSRTISELKIGEIQDVTSSVVGIFPTILRYGDVEVQTAGERMRFLFDDVSDPDGVRDLIIKVAQEKRHEHREEPAHI